MSPPSSASETTQSLRSALRPLLILGAPRSGTKLLRDLIGQSANCTTIPYGLNHVWRLGLPHDANDHRSAADATVQRCRKIRSSLLDLAGLRNTPATGYLVEKTCANTLRVPFVDRVLPDAQYIHIVRDGRDAAVSARNKWKRPPTLGYVLGKLRYVPLHNTSFLLWYLRNLWRGLGTDNGSVEYWGPRYNGMREDLHGQSLLTVCARQWKTCVTTCLDDLSQELADRVISIRYETLVTNQAALDRIIDFLDLKDADSIRTRYQAIVHDHSVGRWRHDLSLEEQRTVHNLLRPTLNRIADISSLSSP